MTQHPIPMTKAELENLLGAILERVQQGDSFEGHVEYLMPAPPEDHRYEPAAQLRDTGTFSCGRCGITTPTVEDQVAFHAGDPEVTAKGERTEFMVKAGFRVGNSMGQGGFVMVGELR